MEPPWVLGTDPARPLAAGLGADLDELPPMVFDPGWSQAPAIERWRDRTRYGPRADGIVVAVWSEAPARTPVVDLDLAGWTARLETPFAWWFAALAVACERCSAGGQVVAVTDRPEVRGSAGWGVESAVADAVEVMARSLAEVARSRGVRVNVVSTSDRLSGGRPSHLDGVLGAVRMLLSAGGPGVNTAVVRVDPGW